MTDIVERLNARKAFGTMDGAHWLMLTEPDPDCQEAAAEIKRLRAVCQQIESRALQAEVYHPQLGASASFAQIANIARRALEPKPMTDWRREE